MSTCHHLWQCNSIEPELCSTNSVLCEHLIEASSECCRLSHLLPWVPAQALGHEELGRERYRMTSLGRHPGPAGACACQRWAARE